MSKLDPWNDPDNWPDDVRKEIEKKLKKEDQEESKELDLADTLSLIMRWYKESCYSHDWESGDEWKTHLTNNNRNVPEEIEGDVKQIFLRNLKRFK
jgi:hypothetical protein